MQINIVNGIIVAHRLYDKINRNTGTLIHYVRTYVPTALILASLIKEHTAHGEECQAPA